MNDHNAAHFAADCDAKASSWVELTVRYAGLTLEHRHLRRARPGSKLRAQLQVALGLGLLAGAAGLFAYDLSLDWETHHQAVLAAQAESRPTPESPSFGGAAIAALLCVCGLVPLIVGGMRREEGDGSRFRIGESPDNELVVPGQGLADAESMTVVDMPAAEGGVCRLQLNEAMLAGLTVDACPVGDEDGRRSLAQSLAQDSSGHWLLRPLAGSIYRFAYAGLDFTVRPVAGTTSPSRALDLDRPLLGHLAGSAALALLAVVTFSTWPPDYGEFDFEESIDPRFFIVSHVPDEQKDKALELEPSDAPAGGGTRGERARGQEGAMGNPKERRNRGRYKLKAHANMAPRLARNHDPDAAARTAGILGIMGQLQASVLASPDGGAFAVGHDDEEVWGQLTGPELGGAYGVGGLGLVGTGVGGGGTGRGTVGLTGIGLVGTGRGGSGGGIYGQGKGTGLGKRRPRTPTVRAKPPKATGMSRAIIRRIVRSHINEVRACYNRGLTRNPNLRGRVTVNFSIGATGRVNHSLVSASSVRDQQVGQCIARAVSRWRFPRPDGGQVAMVTYPFVLNPV